MQGSLDSVVAWAPLADLTPELGPLEVIPGSHLDGLVTSEVVEGFGKVDDAYLHQPPLQPGGRCSILVIPHSSLRHQFFARHPLVVSLPLQQFG
jgi:ectoine hydroxylase-related dioxygenase (phytanoyl-CoA dioxygenase family)